jgi:hypothetical protein
MTPSAGCSVRRTVGVAMRCPSCDTEIPEGAVGCPACGKAPRRPRRPRRGKLSEECEESPGPEAARRNAAARQAYLVCVLGLVPGLGLLLGPLGAALGAAARSRGRGVPGFTAGPSANAAVLLGAIITATQWAGVTLMAFGWGGTR